MYDRFTDRARTVMVLANQEAQQKNHEYIGTEHVLLGLAADRSGVASNVLLHLGVDLTRIREETDKFVQPGRESSRAGNLPLTPRAQKMVEYSLEEADKLKHQYVGTEHLLLAVLRETEGVAFNVLLSLGLVPNQVRAEVLSLLGCELDCMSAAASDRAASDISIPRDTAATLIAVDIGNSRMKLGRFTGSCEKRDALAQPEATFHMQILHESGEFDASRLTAWCDEYPADELAWLVASVHRGATERLKAVVGELASKSDRRWSLKQLTYRDLPLVIDLEAPERVGIDRLLAALAANRLRRPDRATIVVDAGTAIKVDLVDESGAFCGGAILPGVAMAARALEEQTDALPRVLLERLEHPPPALGRSTVAAIEAGLYWGAVGAIRELARRLSASMALPPDILLTGGTSSQMADVFAADEEWSVRHEMHLVLAGIALASGTGQIAEQTDGRGKG